MDIGEYRCEKNNDTASSQINTNGICSLSDQPSAGSGQSLPPVIITVDFGDGSGEQKWSREEPRLLWTHKYQLPGRYWVHVSSKFILSKVKIFYLHLFSLQ